jgi:hypothetical protein
MTTNLSDLWCRTVGMAADALAEKTNLSESQFYDAAVRCETAKVTPLCVHALGGIFYPTASTNSSTVNPAERIRLRSVPIATCL